MSQPSHRSKVDTDAVKDKNGMEEKQLNKEIEELPGVCLFLVSVREAETE